MDGELYRVILVAVTDPRSPGWLAGGRTWWLRIAQGVVLLGAGYYLMRLVVPQLPAIRARDLAWQTGPLLLSAALVFAHLALVIAAWTASLRWCSASITYRDAARVWFTSNLARFLPGTVWQFASLAMLASRYRISAVAATATVLFEQIILMLTGLLVLAALTPAVLRATWWQVALIVGVVLAVVALTVPRPGGRAGLWLERRFPSVRLLWSGLTLRRLLAFTAVLVVPWFLQGAAFHQLALGLFGSLPGTPALYVTAFVGSYLAGTIAVFAPAGLLVREAAMISVLSPVMGSADAVILAAGSRLWLVALEIIAAAVVLSLPGGDVA